MITQKTQKIWLWIFLAMFLIPEILFFTILSSIINYSEKDFLTLSSFFINDRFFINNPFYFFIVLIFEWIGILGLLIINIKSKNKILAFILGIIFLWLSFISILAYISNSIELII